MIPSNPWNSYRQVATQTASPGQLVLMLYDGALRFLDRSLEGFSKDDPAEFNQTISNNVLRAQDIIHELNASLDLQNGGELATHLRRVYLYLDWQLTEANVKKDAAAIQDASRRLSVLRDAWSAMLSGATVSPADLSAQPVLTAA